MANLAGNPDPICPRSVNLVKMRESTEVLERLVASMPPMADSTHLIPEDRERDF
jgi:hypothetical protein